MGGSEKLTIEKRVVISGIAPVGVLQDNALFSVNFFPPERVDAC
jgi:hypothetical protein